MPGRLSNVIGIYASATTFGAFFMMWFIFAAILASPTGSITLRADEFGEAIWEIPILIVGTICAIVTALLGLKRYLKR